MIFGTLLPNLTHITMHLHKKKYSMHAAETLYRAAVLSRAYEQSSGSRVVEGITYDWQVMGSEICTNYTLYEEELRKCVDSDI